MADAAAAAAAAEWRESYEKAKKKSAFVYDIKVDGATRTHPELIESLLAPLRDAEGLESIQQEAVLAATRLRNLGIFSGVDVLLEAPDDLETAAVEAVCAIVTVEEKGPRQIYAGTTMQGSEAAAELAFRFQNLRGWAESYHLTGSFSNERSQELAAIYKQPYNYLHSDSTNGIPTISLTASRAASSWETSSSLKQISHGISAEINNGMHTFGYEITARAMEPTQAASPAARRQAGHNLKSAIRWMASRDNRDTLGMPTRGTAWKAMAEFAGLGPDHRLIRSWKLEAATETAFPLPYGCSLILRSQGGVCGPWAGSQDSIDRRTVADRLFVGGVGSLRGFAAKGIGPAADRGSDGSATPEINTESKTSTGKDFLGGDISAALTARLAIPLPGAVLQALEWHAHAFVGAGTCLTWADALRMKNKLQQDPSTTTPRERVRDVLGPIRVAAGLGLVAPTRLGQLEVNYVRPLIFQNSDLAQFGLQFGFCSQFF